MNDDPVARIKVPNLELGQRIVISGGDISNERVMLENAELPNSSDWVQVNTPPLVKLRTLRLDTIPVDSDQFNSRTEPKTPADAPQVRTEFELT